MGVYDTMSMYLSPDIYVRIEELKDGPKPLPLLSGFSPNLSYRVLGGFTMSESAEMFFLLANDMDEPWFVSNRHCRIDRRSQ